MDKHRNRDPWLARVRERWDSRVDWWDEMSEENAVTADRELDLGWTASALRLQPGARLLDAGLPFAGIVANRVRRELPADDVSDEVEELVGEPLAAKVLATWEDERRLAARDRANLDRLRKRLRRSPMIEIPQLDEDVHDLAGLERVDEYLFG